MTANMKLYVSEINNINRLKEFGNAQTLKEIYQKSFD